HSPLLHRSPYFELADVGSRGEGLRSGAGDDDDAGPRIPVEFLEGSDELGLQHHRQRVQLVGPVQRDERRRIAGLDEEGLELHRGYRARPWTDLSPRLEVNLE